MPSAPSSRSSLVGSSGSALSSAPKSDMIDGDANPTIGNSPSTPPDKLDAENKNYRNRVNTANTKVKLLVRSHAMRESTSPPREPHNNGSSSPQSPQSVDGEKKISPNKLSPNSSANGKQLNNNDSMLNSNLTTSQSPPKQMRNTATSPTCRIPSKNGPSSPSQNYSKNSPSANGNNKGENQRAKVNNGSNSVSKCNNCVKNNQNDKSDLLQTPVSPSKCGQTNAQYSPKNAAQNNQHKSEQRRNTLNVCNNQCSSQCGNTLSVNRTNSRHKLRHQNSSQGSFENASPALSRESSTELYTDSTGIDLEQFIAETINRNQKDRTVLLKIEKDLIEFAKDRQKVCHRFPNMSSYNRMLVHRVAAYFGMEHNVDQTGLSVIVTRTKNMRIPDTRFKEHIRDDLILTEEPRRSILKRDSSSFEDSFNLRSPDRMSGDYCRRSKSFEEREEEYEKARRRIFKDSSGESSEVTSWPYWSSSESSDASARYRLLHPSDSIRTSRLSKGESCDGRDSFRTNVLRPSVSKSFSFGGYTRGMLSRGDSVTSTHSAGARLTKQDSGASVCSRLSPSSSGYKSQSQRSDATISPSPSPSPIPHITCSHTISSQESSTDASQTVMWAVTSIASVPPGSVIINPQTNQPYVNPDGSIYRFDPDNPPKMFVPEEEEPSSELKEQEIETVEVVRSPAKKRPAKIHEVANVESGNNLMNSATSPSLPYSPPPSNPPIQTQAPMVQQPQSSPPIQPLVKSAPVPPCGHNQSPTQYPSYLPTSEAYQGAYSAAMAQPTVMMASHPSTQGQPMQASAQGDVVYNQNPVYANYTVPQMQGPVPQTTQDVIDLSGYFMGMNIYDQRAGGDSQSMPPNPYSQPPPSTNQSLQNTTAMQTSYWQSSANQMPPQQTMYFVPPPGTTAIPVNQNISDRSQMHQQQRFATSYSYNLQTMTPPSQTTSNYMSSYPVPYNSVPTVTPSPGEYTCQPPVHVYYPPGQPNVQPTPVMYRMPTPPNTPTTNQMPSVPLMYVNSGNFAPPTMVSTGTYGHQVGPSGTSPAPPGAYMTPAIVPNLIFRQNVPLVTGVRASTPGSSQRASRSPTPAHEMLGGGSGDRSAQGQSRYPLPMYQGVHIVQGDMRLMHSDVQRNSRLQYASVPSPPVVQGCPRPHRPPYASNASGGGGPNSYEGRSQKIRKQRSKVTTLPSGTGARTNVYQSPSISTLSSLKDIREGTASQFR